MHTFADEYRSTLSAPERRTLSGVDQWCDGVLSRLRGRGLLPELARQAEAILQRAALLRCLSEVELTQQLQRVRQNIRRGQEDEITLQQAFALLLQVAERCLDKRPYAVQVMGALAMQRGYVAQMLPGEGKTLTACLSACVAAWRGRPCHVITSNDYLAARDAQLMAPVYERCGLRVASVVAEMEDPARARAYACHVVYATSKELLADYLRDQMRTKGVDAPDRRLIQQLNRQAPALVMRGLHTAIVDEADSVLIDDAVTPLIISIPGQNRLLKEASIAAREIVNRLETGKHYVVEERHKNVRLTSEAEAFIDSIAKDLPPLWSGRERRLDLLRQALVAREFYRRDRQYIVVDNKVVIVDEKTGRAMPGRSWSYGLHQAVEAKEGLPLTDPSETHARLSFQRFFRRYQKLSGMSGTLQGTAAELWNIYRLPTVVIPPYRPSCRQVLPDRIFRTAPEKWAAVAAEIRQLHGTGRPVLVGTRSIQESEHLAYLLQRENLPCQLLNAHHLAQEAEIIQFAGYPGKITIATNMAGRGTDILLTDAVAEMGGLHVIATERHESSRVDWQMFGRCGRQGQPGVAQAFISLDDELFRIGLPTFFAKYLARHFPRMLPYLPWLIKLLQKRAENKAAIIRKNLLETEVSLKESLAFLGKV